MEVLFLALAVWHWAVTAVLAVAVATQTAVPEAQEVMQGQLMVLDLLSLELVVSVAQAVLAVRAVAEMVATAE